MPSTQTHSGFSSSGFWLKGCRQGKLQSAQRPGQDTQPDLLGTVVLERVRMCSSHVLLCCYYYYYYYLTSTF